MKALAWRWGRTFALLMAAGIPALGLGQPLSGTYTIGGTSPSYATFSAAVSDLNSRGVSAAVTFNVRAGTYNEQVNLLSITGSSSTNTVTFKAESGISTDVTLRFTQTDANASSNYVFRVDSASHVRLLNMTLVSYGLDVNYRSVVVLNGLVSDVVIQGDSLAGWAGSGQNLSLISGTNLSSSDVTIHANRFGPCAYGVYLNGVGASGSPGTVVTANTFSNSTGNGGVYLYDQAAPVVDSNSVTCAYDGIDLYNCPSALSIQRNRVLITTGGVGISLASCNGDVLDYGLVANNVVTTEGTSAYGMYFTNTRYDKIFYNSVNMIGTTASSYALYLAGGNNQFVENNVLANFGSGYAYSVSIGSATFTSDHNDMYVAGSNFVGAWNNTNAIALADLQGLSSMDAHSVSANPNFVSATDLHVNSPWIDNTGTPLTEVTIDIDGHARSGSTPDMGAEEFSASLTKMAGGTYTIGGSSPSYATFTAAVSDLSTRGIAGAITFNVRAGTYNEQVNLPEVAGSSATNTVTFQSESGLRSDVTLRYTQSDANSTSNYVFWLRSASHVRLLNMTLVSYGLNASYRTVVEMSYTSHDVVIQGDSLAGWAGSGQNLALLSGTSAMSSNVTIWGNKFGPASYGVYLVGGGSNASTGTIVKGNTVTNSTGYGGIYLSGQVAPVVDSNVVTSMNDGIDLYGCTSSLSIQRNTVVTLVTGDGIQMYACNGDILDYGLVANNLVTIEGTSNGTGLYIASCNYENFFDNSVNIVATGGASTAMNVSGGGNMAIENNLLANTGGGYAYTVYPGTTVTSDHNDLYAIGANYLAFWNNTNAITLADLQALSGKDANSVTGNPNFVSATDLHPNSPWIDNAGTPVPEVTLDFAGHPRSGSTPDIGAYELTSTITKLPGGTYTIGGTSPNYATFSAAASDLVTRGIAGAVTFNARAGTYSEQVNLPAIAGSSSANTITFQSESGVKTDVTLRFTQTDANNTSNYVMWLRGTRHVRLLNMMLVSYGLNVSYRTVVEVSNTAGDVVIQGDSLTGWAGGGQNLSLISGTSANGSSITDNLTIMGNRFGPAGYAVYLVGSASTETVVKGNTVTNTAGTGGIYLSGHMAPVVDSNSVVCLNDGIDLYGCTSSTSVQKNRVVSTNGGTGIQMYACNGDILDYGLVANNFVTLQGTSNGTGLYAASCTYQNFFNNTINVASGNTSTAMNVSSGGNLSVDDNILINGSGGYAYYVTSASSLVSSNYNDLRTTGSTLAYWVSAAQANLAALQAAGGKDSNSVTEPVTFVSATDLHLSGASIGDRALRGTPLAQVTVDIDGYPRSSTAPYMGANEAAVPLAVNDHKPGENGTPGQAPVVFRLFQNYPNPFNPSTTLKFTVEKQAVTTLDVFDILGRHVATLFDERAEPGQFYSIRFDGTGLASGEYFIRLRSGNRVDMKKIMLLK